MSILDYFKKYAPAGDNNDPVAYAKMVANYSDAANGDVNTKIKDVSPQDMAIPIMKHENV